MNQQTHIYALIPMVLGALMLVVGRIFNDLPLTALSLLLMVWGIAIHANNLARLRREERSVSRLR